MTVDDLKQPKYPNLHNQNSDFPAAIVCSSYFDKILNALTVYFYYQFVFRRASMMSLIFPNAAHFGYMFCILVS